MNDIPNEITNLGQRIAVEMGTAIKVELEGIELPLHSAIVGLESSQYIIVKAPEPFSRVEHKLFKGVQMIVRYLTGGTVYAFQTKVLEVITKPLPLLFIEYPRIIQHHDLREQKRINCHVPARIIRGEEENLGCIIDMNMQGCRCLVQSSKNASLLACEMDNDLRLTCILPGSAETITLAGKVKNLKRTRKELDLGINFAPDLNGTARKTLIGFLSAIDGLSR